MYRDPRRQGVAGEEDPEGSSIFAPVGPGQHGAVTPDYTKDEVYTNKINLLTCGSDSSPRGIYVPSKKTEFCG